MPSTEASSFPSPEQWEGVDRRRQTPPGDLMAFQVWQLTEAVRDGFRDLKSDVKELKDNQESARIWQAKAEAKMEAQDLATKVLAARVEEVDNDALAHIDELKGSINGTESRLTARIEANGARSMTLIEKVGVPLVVSCMSAGATLAVAVISGLLN